MKLLAEAADGVGGVLRVSQAICKIAIDEIERLPVRAVGCSERGRIVGTRRAGCSESKGELSKRH
jgi:hypothetical protein